VDISFIILPKKIQELKSVLIPSINSFENGTIFFSEHECCLLSGANIFYQEILDCATIDRKNVADFLKRRNIFKSQNAENQ
jgi:hypothetical protein